MDKITNSIETNFDKDYAKINAKVIKIQRLVKHTDCDGFFTRNSHTACYIGSIAMLTSLIYIQGSIHLQESKHHMISNLSMINSFAAAAFGGLGSVISREILLHVIDKYELAYLEEMSFDQPWKKNNQISLKKKTYFMNVYAMLDPILIQRGFIAGMVSISLNPSTYHTISAMVNGFVAGSLFVGTMKMLQMGKMDDPSMNSSVHGLMGLYALLSICFFHKSEGFFFRDIYLSYIQKEKKEIAPIILVLGSNALSCFFVILLTAVMTFFTMRFLMRPLVRVSKVQEVVGQDTYFLFAMFDRVIKNHLLGIINQFYPLPAGEFAIKKHKLISDGGLASASNVTKARQENLKNQNLLSLKQLFDMKEIVENEIKKRTIEEYDAKTSQSSSRIQMTNESTTNVGKSNDTYQKKMMLMKKQSSNKSYKSGLSAAPSIQNEDFDDIFGG